jgi:hypothetical protein
VGEADLALDDALASLHECGASELAERLRTDLVGRNVLPGRWTYQVIEEFDEGYWEVFRAHEEAVRDALTGGRRHVFEAEMKQRRRTHGRPGHQMRPG